MLQNQMLVKWSPITEFYQILNFSVTFSAKNKTENDYTPFNCSIQSQF